MLTADGKKSVAENIVYGAFDTIEARADDGSFIAYLRVLYAERSYAKEIGRAHV